MRLFADTISLAAAIALGASLAAAPLHAQAWQGRRGNDDIPPGYRPPPGMCRIWIDGVPPAQQPAPTDCATAVRNRPANGRVIFGDDAARPGKLKPKKFKGVSYSGDEGDERYGAARGRVRDEAEYADRRRVSSVDAAAAGDFAGRGSFPDMTAALQAQEGRPTDDVARWLGGNRAQASPRLADLDGDGVPERAMWFDGAGQLVQVWTDRDRDGRADRIELFESGRRVRVVGR